MIKTTSLCLICSLLTTQAPWTHAAHNNEHNLLKSKKCTTNLNQKNQKSHGVITTETPIIDDEAAIETALYVANLLKVVIDYLNPEESIDVYAIYNHLDSQPKPDTNRLSLFNIKSTLNIFGIHHVYGLGIPDLSMKLPVISSHKEMILAIDQQESYVLITNVDPNEIGIYYPTGQYCEISQNEIFNYLKPVILVISNNSIF